MVQIAELAALIMLLEYLESVFFSMEPVHVPTFSLTRPKRWDISTFYPALQTKKREKLFTYFSFNKFWLRTLP